VKGRGFSRAADARSKEAALAAEGLRAERLPWAVRRRADSWQL